jgi:hypothetical protein
MRSSLLGYKFSVTVYFVSHCLHTTTAVKLSRFLRTGEKSELSSFEQQYLLFEFFIYASPIGRFDSSVSSYLFSTHPLQPHLQVKVNLK